MPVLKHILNNSRNYRRCVLSDIGNHYQSIKHWIPEGEKKAFQERMADAVEEENAWCLGDTFLYYTKDGKRIATGVALFGQNHNTDMLALFTGVFSLEDTDTCRMRFQLHPGKLMSEYKSLLTPTSMKRHNRNPEHPLMSDIQALRLKLVTAIKDYEK